MARKRWRRVLANPGQLVCRYGNGDFGDGPDVMYCNGGKGSSKSDARLLSYALERVEVFDGKSLLAVLKERGYDVTTLRFSIQLFGEGK